MAKKHFNLRNNYVRFVFGTNSFAQRQELKVNKQKDGHECTLEFPIGSNNDSKSKRCANGQKFLQIPISIISKIVRSIQ